MYISIYIAICIPIRVCNVVIVPVGSKAASQQPLLRKSFSCSPQFDLVSEIALVNDFHSFVQALMACSDFERSSDLCYLLLQRKKTDLGISLSAC